LDGIVTFLSNEKIFCKEHFHPIISGLCILGIDLHHSKYDYRHDAKIPFKGNQGKEILVRTMDNTFAANILLK
jgi:hypothetical protein